MAVHALYWAARSNIAEGNNAEAEKLLIKAKKYKNKHDFPIEAKIDRVLQDLKKKAWTL